jgi:Ran GTPase-activating protein (RanGAP) involved in mRNA processing and transport
MCHSITISGNPLMSSDLDELANLLVLDHVHFRKLELAGCSLGDAGLSKLAAALPGQMNSLQVLDISDNHGAVKSDILRHSLNQLRELRKLNLASSTRLDSRYPIFDEAAIHNWSLTELDLSCIVVGLPPLLLSGRS